MMLPRAPGRGIRSPCRRHKVALAAVARIFPDVSFRRYFWRHRKMCLFVVCSVSSAEYWCPPLPSSDRMGGGRLDSPSFTADHMVVACLAPSFLPPPFLPLRSYEAGTSLPLPFRGQLFCFPVFLVRFGSRNRPNTMAAPPVGEESVLRHATGGGCDNAGILRAGGDGCRPTTAAVRRPVDMTTAVHRRLR